MINYSFNTIFCTISVLSDETQSTKKRNNGSLFDVLPFAKGNLEYVKPFKISQNQYEDPRKYYKYENIMSIIRGMDKCRNNPRVFFFKYNNILNLTTLIQNLAKFCQM